MRRITSMLVTDAGDEMCCLQLRDGIDGHRRFCYKHPLSFIIGTGQQHPKDVTNIEIPSPTPGNGHQHKVDNIHDS